MNNNYHTQIDKNNMLNEIAADKHLLQKQQNYQGTPINHHHPSQAQLLQQLQLQMTQQQLQQLNQQQLNQQQMLYAQQLAQQQQNGNIQPQPVSALVDDELELTESKSDATKSDNKEKNRINKQVQQLIQPHQHSPHSRSKQLLPQSPLPSFPPSFPLPLPSIPVSGNRRNCNSKGNTESNMMVDYLITPLILIVLFVVLVHPKTSGILDKYLPSITNFKGLLIRGAILAITYIVIRFATSK